MTSALFSRCFAGYKRRRAHARGSGGVCAAGVRLCCGRRLSGLGAAAFAPGRVSQAAEAAVGGGCGRPVSTGAFWVRLCRRYPGGALGLGLGDSDSAP